MKSNIKYNLDQVVKIHLLPSQKTKKFKFKKAKKNLFVNQKEGFYDRYNAMVDMDKLKAYYFIDENNIVYTRPRCIITFSNNEVLTYYTDTIEEAEKVGDEIIEKSGSYIPYK